MPSKARPRSWIPLDASFLHQDTIADLRDEFGPAGPLTILALIAEAKQQDFSGLKPPSEQGTVSIRASALARLTGATPDAVSAIVSRSVELGLLEYREGTDAATGRLVVRSLKREAWEPHDATSAARKAKSKGREQDQDGDSETEPSESSLPF